MSAPAASASTPAESVAAAWRAYVWSHPEWWLRAASYAGWAVVGATFAAGHGGHAAAPLAAWTAMVVATMLPLVTARARWLALRSLRRRRQRAVATFAAAYLAVWVAVGAVAIALLVPVQGQALAVAGALGAAACWHAAAPRRRMLRRCGATRAPAPGGVRAALDWLRAGGTAGARCVATCGPLMAPMAIAHEPVLTIGIALAIAIERLPGPNPELRAGRRVHAACLALGAVAVAVLGAA